MSHDTSGASSDSHQQRSGAPLWIPLSLLVVTFLVMVAFQTTQLLRERDNLTQLMANLEVPLEQAQRVRQQLDAIARGTAQLAAAGNVNAQSILDQLQRQGITINPKPSQTSN